MVGRRMLAVVAASFVAMTLGACGADDDARVSASTTPTPVSTSPQQASPSASPTAPDGIDPLDGASTDTVSSEAKNTDVALLTAVRAARQEGFDRVVFEFRNAVPGYEVGYVDRPITQDGSGDEVAVEGDAVLQVRMRNAAGVDLTQETAPQTYTGPSRLAPATPEIAELVRTGDFEGTLTWAVGVRDRVDFRVTTLASPPRLVIDLRNH